MLEGRRPRLLHYGSRRSLSLSPINVLRQREICRIAAALAAAVDLQAKVDAFRLGPIHDRRAIELASGQIQLAPPCAIRDEEGRVIGIQDRPGTAVPLHTQAAALS